MTLMRHIVGAPNGASPPALLVDRAPALER